MLRAWRYRLRTEHHEIQFLLNHLCPGQTVIDVGAHKGAYTYWMAKGVGKEGKVIAFEPQPKLNAYLSLIAQHSLSKNILVESMALSSNQGGAILNTPKDKPSPSASINKTFRGTGSEIKIQTITLDQYVHNNGLRKVDFIKCDVEGHELDVFKGAQNTLGQFKPIVLVECEARHSGSDGVNAVFEYFMDHNYIGQFHNGKKFIDLEHFDLYKYQMNPHRKFYVNNFFFMPIMK